MENMNAIRMEQVTHRFGGRTVLRDFRLTLETGRTTCLLGPSGVGKTTVLRILAGLLTPDAGTVFFPENTRRACVFQEYRLLPWRTVAGNLAFVLKGQMPPDEMETVIAEMLDLVELPRERHAWPHQLSGGMKQRVSLARALGAPAELLLLDEPFKGLDILLRQRIMERCRQRWERTGQTVLLITHDPLEAEALGDRVYRVEPPLSPEESELEENR